VGRFGINTATTAFPTIAPRLHHTVAATTVARERIAMQLENIEVFWSALLINQSVITVHIVRIYCNPHR
jgi:hypothetical protein